MAEYKLVLPVFDEETLEIHYYLDEEGCVYNDLRELLDLGTTYLFCYYLKLVYQDFERIVEEDEIKIKFSAKPYTGSPKADFIAPRLCLEIASTQPQILKTRAKYNGHRFYFLDIERFIETTADLKVSAADLEEHRLAIEAFVRDVLPHIPFQNMPNSIAAAARKIFPSTTDGGKIDYLNEIRSSYVGGYYYVKDTWEVKDIIYDYDIKSMYPALLNSHRLFPNMYEPGVPQRLNGFVETNNKQQLAFYHIKTLKAHLKSKHFPTIWREKRMIIKMSKYGVCSHDYINCRVKSLVDGWITSVDYKMLLRDYDIGLLEIDYTYLVEGVPGWSMFDLLGQFYNLKERSVGATREVFKRLIDSYSGSLGMMPAMPHYWCSNLAGDKKELSVEKAAPTTCAPVDVAAFLTAYGRYEITELAYKNGYDNTYSIDTDGIFALDRTLDEECGEGLGSLRLDKVMRRARWFGQKQYESMEDGNDYFTPHIAGLPAYLYEHGIYDYIIPTIQYSKKLRKYIRYDQPFYLTEEDEDA